MKNCPQTLQLLILLKSCKNSESWCIDEEMEIELKTKFLAISLLKKKHTQAIYSYRHAQTVRGEKNKKLQAKSGEVWSLADTKHTCWIKEGERWERFSPSN